MPKAADMHYRLLASAVQHYRYAVDANKNPRLAEEMKATARLSIALVRAAANRVDDRDLQVLCDSADRAVAKS